VSVGYKIVISTSKTTDCISTTSGFIQASAMFFQVNLDGINY